MRLYKLQHILGPTWPRLIFQNQFPNWSQNATAHLHTEESQNASCDVFLAHSGDQKDFVEQLYEDMTRDGINVFFDKKSLEKGQEFPEHLLKAAATSTIAIPVLSEEFFMASSWPMVEIIASVNAKKPILYPLFYMISCETVKDVKKVAEWSAQWESWGMERHNMGVEHWKEALKKIKITYGEQKNVFMSEVDYRKNVVASVSRMVKANKQTIGAANSEMAQLSNVVGGFISAGRKFLERFVVGVPIGLGVMVGQGVFELASHILSGAIVGGNEDIGIDSKGRGNDNVGGGDNGEGLCNDNKGKGRDNGSRNIGPGRDNNGDSSRGGGGWSCGVGEGGGGNKGDVDNVNEDGIDNSAIHRGSNNMFKRGIDNSAIHRGSNNMFKRGIDNSAIHRGSNNMFKRGIDKFVIHRSGKNVFIRPMFCRFCCKPLKGPICKYCKRPYPYLVKRSSCTHRG